MDPELKAYLEGMREGLSRQMNDMRQDLTQQIVETRQENQETRILIEDVRHQVQLVAEGVMTVNEKLDRLSGSYASTDRVCLNFVSNYIPKMGIIGTQRISST